MVLKIRVPFGVPITIRHLLFRVSKRDHNFDNYPYRDSCESLVPAIMKSLEGLGFMGFGV